MRDKIAELDPARQVKIENRIFLTVCVVKGQKQAETLVKRFVSRKTNLQSKQAKVQLIEAMIFFVSLLTVLRAREGRFL